VTRTFGKFEADPFILKAFTNLFSLSPEYTKDPRIKEVVTLTSDLSRKNLEKDFERMDTPQGTFYRVYFDIYLTLDGSEFNAELVCQGEVMGRCSARFR
jgi:hypothetical protein